MSMSEQYLEPAKTVIAKCGGVDAAAIITGKHVSRVYRWMYPKERGGTGGVIPIPQARKLMEYAASHKIDLPAELFFREPAQ